MREQNGAASDGNHAPPGKGDVRGTRLSCPSDDELAGCQPRSARSERSNLASKLRAELVGVVSGPTHLDQHRQHTAEGLVDVPQEADHGLGAAEV
jgi:hypothetical protein